MNHLGRFFFMLGSSASKAIRSLKSHRNCSTMHNDLDYWESNVDWLVDGECLHIIDSENMILRRQDFDEVSLIEFQKTILPTLDERFVQLTKPNTSQHDFSDLIDPGFEWLNRLPKRVTGEFVDSFE